MVIKKALTLVVLQSLMFSAISFASPTENIDENNQESIKDNKAVVQVDKCPSLVKMTNQLVKYIGEDSEGQLFLDAEGYRVNPCKGNSDTVYFFKVDKYPDGKKLFQESKNQVLNGSYYEEVISVNIDEGYKISYGAKNYEVSDIQDFQKNLQTEMLELEEEVNSQNGDVTISSKDIENMRTFFKFEDSYYHNIPEEYSNDIEEEKQAFIQEKIKALIDELNWQIDQIRTEDKITAQELAVTNNRLLNPSNKVIALYTVDEKFATEEELSDSESINPYGEIQGNLYLLYNSSGAKIKYLNASKGFLLDEISNPKLSLDEKFALMVNLTKNKNGNTGIFVSQAEEYKNSLTNEWENNLKKLQTMNPEGLSLYNKASEKEQKEFNSFVKTINAEIIQKEFNSLPNQINKKQYKALSNLDKYKYAPLRDGEFVNKNFYEKTEISRVLKYEAKK